MSIFRIAISLSQPLSDRRDYGHVAANEELLEFITPEIKSKYKIHENSIPFIEGSKSVVFENSLGQIVAFTDADACDPAYKSVGKDSDILPKVYDIDEIELDEEKFCVITMEKLRPLTEHEQKICNNAFEHLWKWSKQDKPYEKIEEFLKTNKIEPLGRAYLILLDKMKKNGIKRFDFREGSYALGHDGKMKLLGWASILVPESWT